MPVYKRNNRKTHAPRGSYERVPVHEIIGEKTFHTHHLANGDKMAAENSIDYRSIYRKTPDLSSKDILCPRGCWSFFVRKAE
jgi:hypothetical protein